jgi:type IV secretion system protein VirD4
MAALCVFGALAFSVLTLAAVWLSGALFLLFNKNNPLRARIDSLPRYWEQHGQNEAQHKRLLAAIATSFGLAYVVVPVAIVAGNRPRRSLYGDARFATFREIERAGLLGTQGIIVGSYKGHYLMLPHDMHVMAAAPTGSGKGTSLIIPNLLNWPGSIVVLDPKGEAYQLTSGFRARYAQQVYRFAPYDEQGHTHRFNPLAYVREDELLRITDLMQIAHVIYPQDDRDPNSSANFFAGACRSLFVTLGLIQMATKGMLRTIGQMVRLCAGDGRSTRDYFNALIEERQQAGNPLPYEAVTGLYSLLKNPDDTLGNIISTFTGALAAFSDPIVDAATSGNDFDLRRLRMDLMSVYAVVPFDRLDQARLVLNLFFTLAVNLNVQEEPKDNTEIRHKCLIVMDEFTAPGRINIVAKGAGFIRSYGLQLFILFQSMGYLTGEYTHPIARSIAANHRCRVLFAPSEQEDAEEQSKALGTMTVKNTSHGRSRSPTGGTTSDNTSDHSRALMLPHELRMMDPESQIVLLESHRPILCTKARYYDDPAMKERLLDPVVVEGIDPWLHLARVRQCVRTLGDDELPPPELELEDTAHDISDVAPLPADASDEEVTTYTCALFAAFREDGTVVQGDVENAIEPGEPGEPDSFEAAAPASATGTAKDRQSTQAAETTETAKPSAQTRTRKKAQARREVAAEPELWMPGELDEANFAEAEASSGAFDLDLTALNSPSPSAHADRHHSRSRGRRA